MLQPCISDTACLGCTLLSCMQVDLPARQLAMALSRSILLDLMSPSGMGRATLGMHHLGEQRL